MIIVNLGNIFKRNFTRHINLNDQIVINEATNPIIRPRGFNNEVHHLEEQEGDWSSK